MSTVTDNPRAASQPAGRGTTSGEADPRGNDALTGTGRRTAILHGDDLGLVYAFNEGIRRAHRQGCLTSTCLRANGFAYDHAVHEVLPECPGLGVGVHLCLNEAGCVAPVDAVRLLLGSDGRQRPGFRWLVKLARTRAGREQIEHEFRAQIEKTLADGVRVDHLNSHQHIHMIPRIFRITCRLAREYGIECVRLAREPAHFAGPVAQRIEPLINTNYVKHLLLNRYARRNAAVVEEYGLRTTDHFVGVNYTGCMTLDTVIAGLRAASFGSVEVLFHPTVGPDPRDVEYPAAYLRDYVADPARATEVEAVTSPRLSEFLQQDGWSTNSFAGRHQMGRHGPPERSAPVIDDRVRGICDAVEVSSPPWVSQAHADARAFAQLVLSQVRPGQRVLDVGTGSGITAICLAKAGHCVAATDLSSAAVGCGTANATRNGVGFDCHRSDLLDSVEGRFDLIAFNPPYNFRPDGFAGNVAKNLARRIPWVRRRSAASMPRAVLRFHQQLIGRLFRQAPAHLTANGALLIHAFESEVQLLQDLLPASASVALLDHPTLRTNRTVGMLVRNLACPS